MIIRRIFAHVYENQEGINKRKQEVIVQMTDSESSSESEGEARALESTEESAENSDIVQPEAETKNINPPSVEIPFTRTSSRRAVWRREMTDFYLY